MVARLNGKWIFCKHKQRDTWEIPGGHVEEGEFDLDAAIRELFEESGVVVSEKESIGQVDEFCFYFDGEKAIKRIKVFAFVTNKTQALKLNREEGFENGGWFDTETAIRQLKHDDARNALKKALKTLEKERDKQ